MIENAVKSIQELNQVAGHLRQAQEFDRIKKLAYTWLVPDENVEDFIAGKRYLLADMDIEEKDFASATAKLAEEMGILSDEYFADTIGAYVSRKCSDEAYGALVLQRHKTLQKCLDYILGKAYAIAEEKQGKENIRSRQRTGMAMSSAVVFAWADEYYSLDDAREDAEKREKAREEYIEERAKREQREKENALREEKRKEREKKRAAKEQEKKEQEKAARAQISLFDIAPECAPVPTEKCGQDAENLENGKEPAGEKEPQGEKQEEPENQQDLAEGEGAEE